MTAALLQTSLPLPLSRRGKVRDVYDLGDSFLFVATDRISAFDVVLSPGIPDKGKILNQIATFWFRHFPNVVNHILESDFDKFPSHVRAHEELRGRSVIVRKCEVIPIECVARGYLVGSGWSEYKKSGTVCGIKLDSNLQLASKLREPIFTPSTKEETGHDINISYEEMSERVGEDLASQLRDLTLMLYTQAAEYALSKGIIIADTKFELGLDDEGRIVLGDEIFTPDSSRFWPADTYKPGAAQASLDKQFVRDYLESIRWDKNPPAPPLPDNIVQGTAQRYREIFRRLTDRDLE